jgi:hypothetical protein
MIMMMIMLMMWEGEKGQKKDSGTRASLHSLQNVEDEERIEDEQIFLAYLRGFWFPY